MPPTCSAAGALFVSGLRSSPLASLVNALASSGEMLIVARAFQGLGGALVSPAALSIITTTFKEGPDRTKALGIWGGIAAGAPPFGLSSGLLTEALSWQWIFFVNVPVGIAPCSSPRCGSCPSRARRARCATSTWPARRP